MTSRPNGPAGSAGFSLLEVLIAVLVLGIGLLGLAGLQATSLRNNLSAYHRSVATQLAYDISDRMRANPQGVTDGNYNNKAGREADCVTNRCSSADLAGDDLFEWSDALKRTLPEGKGTVCIDGTPDDDECDFNGRIYAIKIWWDDSRSGNADEYQRFVTSFLPLPSTP